MKNKRSTSYFAIEGIDGIGKSKCAHILSHKLSRASGKKVYVIHDPDSTHLGKFVDSSWNRAHMQHPAVMALLFAASSVHAQHRMGGIFDKLRSGAIVIGDRCALSTYAYLVRKGMGLDWLHAIHYKYTFPDHTIFIQGSPHIAFSRLYRAKRARNCTLSQLDQITKQYLKAINYLVKKKKSIEVMRVRDTDSPDEIANRLLVSFGHLC